ncbi:hypothetical protein K439DRAFT_216995 [Ramaria rubella]|nr:hypothetical protein K439DRAFT_216995 [Ramaria rubella]
MSLVTLATLILQFAFCLQLVPRRSAHFLSGSTLCFRESKESAFLVHFPDVVKAAASLFSTPKAPLVDLGYVGSKPVPWHPLCCSSTRWFMLPQAPTTGKDSGCPSSKCFRSHMSRCRPGTHQLLERGLLIFKCLDTIGSHPNI